jgi:hypothetical protein
MGVGGYNKGYASSGDAEGNYTNGFGGTSSSAPLTAGIAALLLSREPDLSREGVMDRLIDTVDRVDLRGALYDLKGQSVWYGSGRVNAYAALTVRTRHPQLAISAEPSSIRRGSAMSLNFSLCQGSEMGKNIGTAYLMLLPPSGPPQFITHDYRATPVQTPFVQEVRAIDIRGTLSPGIATNMPAGRYRIYAAIITPGGDPLDPSSWLHNPSSTTIDVMQ